MCISKKMHCFFTFWSLAVLEQNKEAEKIQRTPLTSLKSKFFFQRRGVPSSKYVNRILDHAFVKKIRNLLLKNQKTNYFSKTKVKVIP